MRKCKKGHIHPICLTKEVHYIRPTLRHRYRNGAVKSTGTTQQDMSEGTTQVHRSAARALLPQIYKVREGDWPLFPVSVLPASPMTILCIASRCQRNNETKSGQVLVSALDPLCDCVCLTRLPSHGTQTFTSCTQTPMSMVRTLRSSIHDPSRGTSQQRVDDNYFLHK